MFEKKFRAHFREPPCWSGRVHMYEFCVSSFDLTLTKRRDQYLKTGVYFALDHHNINNPYIHNDPKFLDRQVWANSADTDQTAPEGNQPEQGLHFLPNSFYIFWMHYSTKGKTFQILEYLQQYFFMCPNFLELFGYTCICFSFFQFCMISTFRCRRVI